MTVRVVLGQVYDCPGCGAQVLVIPCTDGSGRGATITHVKPVCEVFAAKMAEHQGVPTPPPAIEAVVPFSKGGVS